MNEREIIACLHKRKDELVPGLIRGIGDDCAVIAKDKDRSLLVTMDTLVEGVHFDLSWHPPEKLGRKAVAVNVSDIGAMGGSPLYVFLSLGLPPEFNPAWLHDFSDGIDAGCREYDCFLVGGDTVRSREGVLITITVIGEAPADEVVYRSGAHPGDTVWVSGTLGRAAAGLELCRKDIDPGTGPLQSLVEAHLDPQPRVHLGRWLAEEKIIHAMMDLSDGLATDLSHLCVASGVGAVIHADRLPAEPELARAAQLVGRNALDLMIRGGEDYELVFTAGSERQEEIESLSRKAGVSVTPVGTVVKGPGVRMILPGEGKGRHKEIDISFGGFDHFPRSEG